eukprot:scaffold98003_cov55-Attheya_sp.AAC.4
MPGPIMPLQHSRYVNTRRGVSHAVTEVGFSYLESRILASLDFDTRLVMPSKIVEAVERNLQEVNSSSSRPFVEGCDRTVPLLKIQQTALRERKSFCRSYPP